MSEYQYVAFRAVDRPLDEKQLAFADKQSSHSELSRWEMSVEYHYSSFRGDVNGLLRRGFDVHLAYTNYGIREVKLRLPSGLPFSKPTLKPFLACNNLNWKKDPKGKAGILTVAPFRESGEIEEVWDFDDYLDAMTKVREQLIGGDLRAIYLLWLCAASDDYEDPSETIEPPVPHGLETMPACIADLMSFFGLDPLMLRAAAEGIPAFQPEQDDNDPIQVWTQSISDARSRALLRRLLKDDAASVKAELLAEIRDAGSPADWPVTNRGHSLDDLLSATEAFRKKTNEQQRKKARAKARREAAKAEKERQARIKKMKGSPKTWLAQAEKVASAGGTHNYKAAAEILADLREAVGGDKGDKLARNRAAKIAKAHPTLNMLKSSLRKRGLLD